MRFRTERCVKAAHMLLSYWNLASRKCACVSIFCHPLWKGQLIHIVSASIRHQDEQCPAAVGVSDVDVLISKVHVGNTDDQLLQSIRHDRACDCIEPSHDLVDKLLRRFKDDWKSALGFFRWAESYSDFEHLSYAYDMMVDILGKAKQMERMGSFLEEVSNHVTPNTVGKAMRRLCGAGQWEDAVEIFDKLEIFGLEKNTESMNLLLDTLCKEKKVEQAREIFVELKSHIAPNSHTFNIFIHGWCRVGRVEEAQWTIQEMKGCGCCPCVISYSTIVEFFCRQSNFSKVYELLDCMEAEGFPPNIITFTTIISSMAKSEKFEEALQIYERIKLVGCKPDTLFYNALIHILGRASRVQEASNVFLKEMPRTGVTPNTSTYNTMIAMFCRHGQVEQATNLLREIENSRICKPDVQSYYPLLKSCFRTRKVNGNLSKMLDDMVNKHHLSLDISTYTLLIHGLCHANKCEWAFNLFDEMLGREVKPKHRTCRLLLDKCKENLMYQSAEKVENVMRKI